MLWPAVKLHHQLPNLGKDEMQKERIMRIEEIHDQHPNPGNLSVREWNALIEEGVARGRALHGAAVRQAFRWLIAAPIRAARRLSAIAPQTRQPRHADVLELLHEPVHHARADLERPVVATMDTVLDHPKLAILRQRRGNALGLGRLEDRIVPAVNHKHR